MNVCVLLVRRRRRRGVDADFYETFATVRTMMMMAMEKAGDFAAVVVARRLFLEEKSLSP